MREVFTLERILSNIRPDLLIDYLSGHGLVENLKRAEGEEHLHTYIILAVRQAGRAKKTKIEDELRELHRHADDGYIQTVLDAANKLRLPLNLAGCLARMSSFHDRCLWLLLNHPGLYKACLRFDDTDGFKFHKRPVPVVEVPPGKEDRRALTKALSDNSVARGLGKGFRLEEYTRGDSTYFFLQLEHSERSEPNFDSRSRFKMLRHRPAYDIIFDYNPVELTLRTYVRGGQGLRRSVEAIFGQTMLGVELPPESIDAKYDLSRFMNALSLELEPQDEVERVQVTEIRYDFLGEPVESITAAVCEFATVIQTENFMERLLARKPPSAEIEVGKVRIRAIFRAGVGKRALSRSFYITRDSCTLGDSQRDDILKALLKRWKIDVFEAPGKNTSEVEQSVQCALKL